MAKITKVALAFILFLLLPACRPPANTDDGLKLTDQGLYAGALGPHGELALVSPHQGPVTLWDLVARRPKYRWILPADSGNQVLFTRFNDDGQLALTATRHHFAIWETGSGQARGYWSIADGAIQDIDLSHNGRYVLLGLDNAKAVHLDLQTGRRLEFLGHREKINAVALSPNGRYALTGGNDYQALLWDTGSAAILLRMVHGSRVTRVALESQGRYAFTADSANQARIWRLADGQPQSRLQLLARQQIFSAARFVADGSRLLTGSPARQLQLWNSLTGTRLAQYAVQPQAHKQPAGAVVLDVSLKGDTLLSLASSGYLEYWPATGVEYVAAGDGTAD